MLFSAHGKKEKAEGRPVYPPADVRAMSILWSDSDPIIEPFEQLDTEPLLLCEFCGEVAAELTTVNDSDPSVGYSDSQELCAACVRRLRAKRGL